jgi:hypothetical protein
MDKLNIILDLDECCINSILYDDENYLNKQKFRNFKNKLKKSNILVYFFKYTFIKNQKNYSITFKRPFLKEFITYLFKNYNVSVWSNGYYTYVDEICNLIFTSTQRKQLKYIFGQSATKGVYDIINKKSLYNLEKTGGSKDLNFLFKNKPYSKIFNKENTILIDDSKHHLKFNKNKNVIRIKYWSFTNINDNILLNIIEYLKSNKVNVSKLKHFLRQKKSKKNKK